MEENLWINYSVVQLRNKLKKDDLRKLRGAISKFMLAYTRCHCEDVRNVWSYGHDAPAQLDRVPELTFRLCDKGKYPELVFQPHVSQALVAFISSCPVHLELGKKQYCADVHDVYEVLLPIRNEPQVFQYELTDVVPFNRAEYPTYTSKLEALEIDPRSNYDSLTDTGIHKLILGAVRRQLENSYAQIRAAQALVSDEVGATFPTGTLLHVSANNTIKHRKLFGSGRVPFSAFTGIRVSTNVRLPHHWGAGLERAHGAGQMQIVQK